MRQCSYYGIGIDETAVFYDGIMMRFNARIKDHAIAYLRIVLDNGIVEDHAAFSDLRKGTYICGRIYDVRCR